METSQAEIPIAVGAVEAMRSGSCLCSASAFSPSCMSPSCMHPACQPMHPYLQLRQGCVGVNKGVIYRV